jgi:hypothetical protein
MSSGAEILAAARLEPRFGRGVTITGALIMAAGMAALIGIGHHFGAAVSTWDLVPGLLAFLLMLALPARRGHSGGPSSV